MKFKPDYSASGGGEFEVAQLDQFPSCSGGNAWLCLPDSRVSLETYVIPNGKDVRREGSNTDLFQKIQYSQDF